MRVGVVETEPRHDVQGNGAKKADRLRLCSGFSWLHESSQGGPAFLIVVSRTKSRAGDVLKSVADQMRNDSDTADSRGLRIGILVVAYNAVTTLAEVLGRIPQIVWDNVHEVYVSDDASRDSTFELGLGYKLARAATKLTVVRQQNNLGYGGNQINGYRYFIENKFDVVVLLHGDGQYSPEMIADLYNPIVSGEADAVFGSRMMGEYGGALKGGMPLYKFVGNRILTLFENSALGMNLTEFHCGYRAYSVAALREIDFSRMTPDFHFDTQIIIKLQHQGFRIKEVPIPTHYGDEICYVNGMKYAWNVYRAVRRYKATTRSVQKHPEYTEYFTQYPLKESKYSSHYYLLRQVGRGTKVLDIGCGEGHVAAKLSEQANAVTGVDILESPKNLESFEFYHQADLSTGLSQIADKLEPEAYDRVLLTDVIEHVPNPSYLLNACRSFLGRNGDLIVSVPNVANIVVRLNLLFGRFEYSDRGILDRTHLRFFTRRSARRLLASCGYRTIKEMPTVVPLELVVGLPENNFLMVAANRLLALITSLLPSLLGYQWIFVCRKVD